MISYGICLSVSDFTQYDNLWVHPCCCKWHCLILFYGWVIAHWTIMSCSQSPGIWEFSASFPDSPLPSLLAPTSTLLSSQGVHRVHPWPPWNALSSPLCQESTPTHPYKAHFTHHLSWGLNKIMFVKCLVYSQLWPNMNCIWSLGQEDPLEKRMATHSSIFAWRIPWREEPGGLQSMGLQRAGHNWATNI